MEQIDTNKEETKTTPEVVKNNKDIIAICSLGLGVASIFFAWIGIVPLLAMILGAVGISRTKKEGTGRGFAVAGLVLGIVFFISSMYLNGHLEGLTSSATSYRPQSTSVAKPVVENIGHEMTAEPVDFIKKEYKDERGLSSQKYTFAVKFTNKTEQTIVAFKTRLCIDTVLDVNALCDNIEKFETIPPNESIIVDFKYDSYEDMMQRDLWLHNLSEVKDSSNLKATLNDLGVVYQSKDN